MLCSGYCVVRRCNTLVEKCCCATVTYRHTRARAGSDVATRVFFAPAGVANAERSSVLRYTQVCAGAPASFEISRIAYSKRMRLRTITNGALHRPRTRARSVHGRMRTALYITTHELAIGRVHIERCCARANPGPLARFTSYHMCAYGRTKMHIYTTCIRASLWVVFESPCLQERSNFIPSSRPTRTLVE